MENMTKKIFITGCAKTGTTLLLRMCYAFKDTEVLYEEGFNGHELTIDELVERESDQKFLIGKRLPPTILSNIKQEQFLEQAQWIKTGNIGIINVTGYAGAELVRILHNHPEVTIKSITGRSSAGKRLEKYFHT